MQLLNLYAGNFFYSLRLIFVRKTMQKLTFLNYYLIFILIIFLVYMNRDYTKRKKTYMNIFDI